MKKVCAAFLLVAVTLLNVYFIKDALNGRIHTVFPQTEKRCQMKMDSYVPCIRLGGEEDTVIKANRLSYVAILDNAVIWALASYNIFFKNNAVKQRLKNYSVTRGGVN